MAFLSVFQLITSVSFLAVINPLMPAESCRFVQVCVTFLLPPGIKGLICSSLFLVSNRFLDLKKMACYSQISIWKFQHSNF